MTSRETTREPVLVYGRISEDTKGQGESVADQLVDVRQLADLRGWQVVDTFSDNDVSALNGAYRRGYEQLMAAVRAGQARRIVVAHTSRLWRNRRERAEGIEALARARVSVAVLRGTDLDLSSAQGRSMAGIMGEMDTWESEIKSERIQAAAVRRAREGRTNGGVLYGWTRHHERTAAGRVIGWRDVEDPEQAAIVREITDRVLAGDTLTGIRDDLNARGVPAPGASLNFKTKKHDRANPTGTAWGRSSVRKMAVRPANAALRVFHRGQPDEDLLPADWPELVPRERWERVVALITDPSRQQERPASRQHLLTWGIGECGVCGGNLRVATKNRRSVLYVCDRKGCTGRAKVAVDDLVRAVVTERLSRPNALGWLQCDDEESQAAADLAAVLRARLDTAADQYAAGDIEGRQLQRITARLRPEIERAEQTARRHLRPVAVDALVAMAGPMAEQSWDAASVTSQRAVLEAMGVRVVINRTRPGPGFDPESVEFIW
jgi:DNA invertase Pin-like site-specific DNA recombinase